MFVLQAQDQISAQLRTAIKDTTNDILLIQEPSNARAIAVQQVLFDYLHELIKIEHATFAPPEAPPLTASNFELTDEEMMAAASGIFLSDFARPFDFTQAVMRAALACAAKKAAA